jgi:hypothetical protein
MPNRGVLRLRFAGLDGTHHHFSAIDPHPNR